MALPPPTVTLGPVTLTGREVPDDMPFGGKQSLSIKKNLGGVRNIDVMGPDPDPITWSGLFYGPDASKRARLLDALKDNGSELLLSWGRSFSFMVVISRFNAKYKNESLVHYRISCEISQINAVLSLESISAQVNQDWTSALAVSGIPSSITTAIQTAQTTYDLVAGAQPSGDISNASLADLQPAILALETAYDAADAQLAISEADIGGVSLDAFIGNSALETFNNFSTEANNIAVASNLRIAMAYLGRIVGNLTSLGG